MHATGGEHALASSSRYNEDVHFGTHLQIWGSWYDVERQVWGYGCCRCTEKKKRHCPKTAPNNNDAEDCEDIEELDVHVSRRVAELLEECPNFSGDVPKPEQEREWTLLELRNYIYSNGLIRPARQRGERAAPPVEADWKILEVREGTDIATVRRSYKRLALLYHPDKHVEESAKKSAGKKFQRLAAAFQAICGHEAEVPAVSATDSRKRQWRIHIVE